MKVRAAYQEYDKELIEAQQKQREIYNIAIPKVVTHQQNAYKVNNICQFRPIKVDYKLVILKRAISATIECMNDLKSDQVMEFTTYFHVVQSYLVGSVVDYGSALPLSQYRL